MGNEHCPIITKSPYSRGGRCIYTTYMGECPAHGDVSSEIEVYVRSGELSMPPATRVRTGVKTDKSEYRVKLEDKWKRILDGGE